MSVLWGAGSNRALRYVDPMAFASFRTSCLRTSKRDRHGEREGHQQREHAERTGRDRGDLALGPLGVNPLISPARRIPDLRGQRREEQQTDDEQPGVAAIKEMGQRSPRTMRRLQDSRATCGAAQADSRAAGRRH